MQNISYELNELGSGRWQREAWADATDAEDDYIAAPHHHYTPRRWLLPSASAALMLAIALLLLTFSTRAVASSVSNYVGASGSYPLLLSVPNTSSPADPALHDNPVIKLLPATPTLPPAPSVPAKLAANVHPSGDYHLLGAPSISVATIEQVLQQYNSPASGNGQAFYDLGVKYGVDPTFMLAFYVHESSAGTQGAAVDTKSIGNIICPGWAGRCIGRFRAYDSYTQAAEDWYQLIAGPLYIGDGLDTPAKITPRYAPDSDNNDSNGYAQTVQRMVDEWRSQQLAIDDW